MDSCDFVYDAFISYRHLPLDKAVAEKLQALLEAYRPPRSGNYLRTNRIRRVFRDQSELPTSGDLASDIKKALEQSFYLIVICSEKTAESKWCMQEIEYFKSLHGGKCGNILTVLVSGDPNVVFFDSLRFETQEVILPSGETIINQVEIEPLAANVVADSVKKSIKLLKTEFLRIAAPILGCKYDDLYRRNQRRIIRRIVQASCLSLLFVVAISAYVVYNQARITEQRLLVEAEKTMRALSVAEDLMDSGDKILTSAILLDLVGNTSNMGEYTKLEIERLLAGSTYIPKDSQYAAMRKEAGINACVLSDDSSALFTVCDNGDVDMWDVGTGMLINTFAHEYPVCSLLVGQDALYALSGNTLALWDVKSGEKTGELAFDIEIDSDSLGQYYESSIIADGSRFFALYPDYSMLVSGDFADGTYDIADIEIDGFPFRPPTLDVSRGLLLYSYEDSGILYCVAEDLSSGEKHEFTYDCGSMLFMDCDYDDESGSFLALFFDEGDLCVVKFAYDATGNAVKTIIEIPGDIDESYLHNPSFGYAWSFFDFADNASLITIGDYIIGGVLVVDLNDQSNNDFCGAIIGSSSIAGNVDLIEFVDNEKLLIARDAFMPILWDIGGFGKELPNMTRTATYVCAISDATIALGNSYGEISLISRTKSAFERTVEIELNSNGYPPFVGEVKNNGAIAAISPDGKYRLVHRLTAAKPEHYIKYEYDEYVSYWLEDCETGTELFDAKIPFADFSFISIKDDEIGILIRRNINTLCTFNLRTGEVYEQIKLDIDLNNIADTAQFTVDYESGRANLIFGRYVMQSFNGYILSTKTGKSLFEFATTVPFLVSDMSGRAVYRSDDYLYDFLYNSTETGEVVAYTLPTYDELIELAGKLVGSRAISDEERESLGLSSAGKAWR